MGRQECRRPKQEKQAGQGIKQGTERMTRRPNEQEKREERDDDCFTPTLRSPAEKDGQDYQQGEADRGPTCSSTAFSNGDWRGRIFGRLHQTANCGGIIQA